MIILIPANAKALLLKPTKWQNWGKVRQSFARAALSYAQLITVYWFLIHIHTIRQLVETEQFKAKPKSVHCCNFHTRQFDKKTYTVHCCRKVSAVLHTTALASILAGRSRELKLRQSCDGDGGDAMTIWRGWRSSPGKTACRTGGTTY